MGKKFIGTKEFLNIMKQRGLWANRFSLYRYEDTGKLTLPKTPARRIAIPEDMLEDIIAAFSPGGSGEWHYQDRK